MVHAIEDGATTKVVDPAVIYEILKGKHADISHNGPFHPINANQR